MNGCRTKAGRRPPAAGVGQEAGIDHRHARQYDLAEFPRRNPALEIAVPRPETPILMHHEAELAVNAAHQVLGLAESRRQRLLTQHVDAARRCGLDPRSMRLARRGDVERVDRLRRQHRVAVLVDLGDAELLGATSCMLGIGVADGDEVHALAELAPGGEVVPADHAGACQGHLVRGLPFRVRHRVILQIRRAGPRPLGSRQVAGDRPRRRRIEEMDRRRVEQHRGPVVRP